MTSATNPGRQSIDYERHGHEYARWPDPRIGARMSAALGDAPMVVNIRATRAFMGLRIAMSSQSGTREAAGQR
jgi:hypothetical protein